MTRISDTHAYRRVEAAYENQNPYDDDCTCDTDEHRICDDCGQFEGDGECGVCALRLATWDEVVELRPDRNCPCHGSDDYDDYIKEPPC
jgi:hypothetical protein